MNPATRSFVRGISILRHPGMIFGAALALRVAFMLVLDYPPPVEPDQVEWVWGGEQSAVARALLRGEGLADPFARGTGPTAWCGGVYPVLLAGLIRCFGTTGEALPFWLGVVNSTFSAATAVALFCLGRNLGRPRLGVSSAWLWALHPGAIYFPVSYVWDASLIALGITAFVALLARHGPRPTAAQAFTSGTAIGALAVVNPSVLALVPVVALYWLQGRSVAHLLLHLSLFALAAAVVMSPWLARNKLLLGSFQPKATLGVELMVGNNDEADGGFRPHLHPRHNLEELAAYRDLGEVEYGKRCQGLFLEWMFEHPERFAQLVVTRVRLWWFGFDPFEPFPLRSGDVKQRDWQGWVKWWTYFADGVLCLVGVLLYRDDRRGKRLLVGSLALFPAVYYFAHVMERYRFPISPLMVFLITAALLWAFDRVRVRAA